jgi:hypothetical protein
MGSNMQLKLGVLILLVAAVVADDKYNFYIEVDTPFIGSTRDVILGVHNKGGAGATWTVRGFALQGMKRRFHLTGDLVDPCRLTLQLKQASGPFDAFTGGWIPSRVEIVVYKKSGKPATYLRKFQDFMFVTHKYPLERNLC